MLRELRLAERSSNNRWQFACGVRLITVVLGYFLVLPVLNRYFGMPDDLPMLVIQFIGYAVICGLVFFSHIRIADVVAASSVLCNNVFLCFMPLENSFSDFLPEVVTPPPNL